MANETFFDHQLEQSHIKSEIVSKYFEAWARVIVSTRKITGRGSSRLAYIDLFCGPGHYSDGTKSTPLLVLDRIIQAPELCDSMETVFNDSNPQFIHSLTAAISEIPDISLLKYKPQIFNFEVGLDVVELIENREKTPTLLFIDPWGYKGLSLRLVESVLGGWGSDCIFFFNYNRINPGLSNEVLIEPMSAVFGEDRAVKLRGILRPLPPHERELAVVEELSQALKDIGGNYVLPFTFKNSDGTRTSHHLIFVSKHILGYEIMKDIMAKESSDSQQGVPSFEYNPATRRQPLLFELNRPLDDLADMLLQKFAGQNLSVLNIYRGHHVGRRFVRKNYKDVLKKLEANNQIAIIPAAHERRKSKGELTLKDAAIVSFPPKD